MKGSEIINELAPEKLAVFVSGDPGVTLMQDYLKKLKLQMLRKEDIKQKEYDNANGVFLRFSTEGIIHSGIVQTKNRNKTRSLLIELSAKLQKENVTLLTVFGLPLARVSLFPFFTTLDYLRTGDIVQKMRKQYWTAFDDDMKSLKNWYEDLINYRREIINNEVPQIAFSAPSWIRSLAVYVLYNEKERSVSTRYYRSQDSEDVVLVKRTTKHVGLKTEEDFSDIFQLPSKQAFIMDVAQWGQEGEKVFSNWDHPYFSAVKEVEEEVIKFNQAQPSIYYDAYSLSSSFIHNWTYKEVCKRRELAKKFPDFKTAFDKWLKPVQALVLYYIENAVKGRVTDGVITSHFANGPEDKIVVKKAKEKEDIRKTEDLFKEFLPASQGKSFFGTTSIISYYLRKKLGAD